VVGGCVGGGGGGGAVVNEFWSALVLPTEWVCF
jgi:hypothetical protein